MDELATDLHTLIDGVIAAIHDWGGTAEVVLADPNQHILGVRTPNGSEVSVVIAYTEGGQH